ncbi:LysR substrate-binding domain-containing protein [Alsobacter sp. KACC 23698]|uniref:LysR substrate-binding domain-containing protein n=1 Tax=Alsobacter sp. KACC 23698 TaxID=3149229 RepID=A0AAU7JND4_9HYPH
MAALEAAAVSLAALRDAPQSIRLHVLPILGDRWLVPRFTGFAERHPEIDVQFTTFVTSDVAEEADGVFRFGEGVWPGHDADYLFGRTVLLVGAPHLLQRQGPLATPADVARFPMLEHFQTPLRWSEFTQAHGLDAITPSHTIRFGFYALVIRAAIFGQGLALVPKRLVEEELASGKLVNPCGLHFESRHVYYFTTPKGRRPKRELRLFRDWLIAEAGQTGGLAPAKELDA